MKPVSAKNSGVDVHQRSGAYLPTHTQGPSLTQEYV
jgi:hypothetical protein